MANLTPNSNASTPPGATPLGADERSELIKAIESEKAARAALIAEFSTGTDADKSVAIRKVLSEHAVAAADTIVNLAQFAESDAIRGSNAKYIIDVTLGLKGASAPPPDKDDALTKLIERLSQGVIADDAEVK